MQKLKSNFIINNENTSSLFDGPYSTQGTGSKFLIYNNSLNVVINFGTPTIVAQFHTHFHTSSTNAFLIPQTIEVSASNDDVNYQSLAEGGRIFAGGIDTTFAEDSPSFNPLGLFGVGIQSNLNRITQIPLTSLTQSFQYYKIKYDGMIDQSEKPDNNTIQINEINVY